MTGLWISISDVVTRKHLQVGRISPPLGGCQGAVRTGGALSRPHPADRLYPEYTGRAGLPAGDTDGAHTSTTWTDRPCPSPPPPRARPPRTASPPRVCCPRTGPCCPSVSSSGTLWAFHRPCPLGGYRFFRRLTFLRYTPRGYVKKKGRPSIGRPVSLLSPDGAGRTGPRSYCALSKVRLYSLR